MDADPWFVLYKGPMQYKLKPCSRGGWLSFAVFMMISLAPMMIMPLLPNPLWGLALWVVVFPILFFVFWRFARARAKVIDLGAVEKDWAEFDGGASAANAKASLGSSFT